MASEIRALTVRQPWASLLSQPTHHTRSGKPRYAKRYETRSWATSYRGPIAIHAGAASLREGLRGITQYKQLREICSALLPILYRDGVPEGVDWQTVALDLAQYDSLLPRGAVICTGVLRRCIPITEEFAARQSLRERALGDWTPGRYAWEITDRRPCPPVAVRGAQGLWIWR